MEILPCAVTSSSTLRGPGMAGGDPNIVNMKVFVHNFVSGEYTIIRYPRPSYFSFRYKWA